MTKGRERVARPKTKEMEATRFVVEYRRFQFESHPSRHILLPTPSTKVSVIMSSEESSVSLSVIATTAIGHGPVASTHIRDVGVSCGRTTTTAGGTIGGITSAGTSTHAATVTTGSENSTDGTTTASNSTTSSTKRSATHSPISSLDFIGTGGSVKKLFSIPIADESICVAVHNINGTLLVDEVVVPEEGEDVGVETTAEEEDSEKVNRQDPQLNLQETTHYEHYHQHKLLPPTSPNLALALSPSFSSSEEYTEREGGALGLLSKMMQNVKLDHSPQRNHEKEGSSSSSHQDETSAMMIQRILNPSPVRDYVEWKVQDMKLLVGSDAMIVRPEKTGNATEDGNEHIDDDGVGQGVVIRVEEVQHLRRVLAADQQREQERQPNCLAHVEEDEKTPVVTTRTRDRSYAEALLKPKAKSGSNDTPSKALLNSSSVVKTDSESIVDETATTSLSQPMNLDQVQLQTCIVPSSGPLGGWMTSLTTTTTSNTTIDGHQPGSSLSSTSVGTSSSSKCIVLDAYLDNLMANVPQLALCLQEKGLIQSVKLLHRDQIPSMMMHPRTLDTSTPLETISSTVMSGTGSTPPNLFSPEIMEMNATALLRFLKTNCTSNNTTYLLRTDVSNGNKIELYDISSISQQRQKKWIWWLATMSYRFALRLRQLESHDVLPAGHQRAFRNRQRNLLQSTLDLLQDLKDMDGNPHESLVASVREHLADTFLGETANLVDATTNPERPTTADQHTMSPNTSPVPVMSSSSPALRNASPVPFTNNNQGLSPSPPSSKSSEPQQYQPYSGISPDALNKAQDHLISGIKTLWPVLENQIRSPKTVLPAQVRRRKRVGEAATVPRPDPPSPAMVSQLFGLNYKVVSVTLRLAEHYLGQYSSSSAMQSLRHAARRMADSIGLLEYLSSPKEWIPPLRLQYTWLWEHCGHFARSFASDDLWRERGHATGDDILYVLKDVETAFTSTTLPYNFSNLPDPIRSRTKGLVSLQSLSAVYSPKLGQLKKENTKEPAVWEEARSFLWNRGLLQRDKRQVLVASCVSYQRAIVAFEEMLSEYHDVTNDSASILTLLRQRLGDACNETGKVLLASLRSFLTHPTSAQPGIADVLLDSAQFWFLEGLEAFEAGGDLRNMALLRCNLCQCCKLRANASFSSQATTHSSSVSHAEVCLEKAVSHLQAAHVALGTRETDPVTWDMVSDELAATFLVLAVRRRQSLLGGGAAPVLSETLRLSPGKERSIMEPMEKALAIYQQSGNLHQAAAVQYQLALTNSKVWTCQRDEAMTRQKLSAAFTQYQSAFAYFASHMRGNEPTYVLLCLDIASLYATVSGEECLEKALSRCLDTVDAFSEEAMATAGNSTQWWTQMETLASSIDDRIFKLLRSLAKLESTRCWKDLYREGLTAKMSWKANDDTTSPSMSAKVETLTKVHAIMVALRNKLSSNNR